jgi:hypothetical protein
VEKWLTPDEVAATRLQLRLGQDGGISSPISAQASLADQPEAATTATGVTTTSALRVRRPAIIWSLMAHPA